MPTSTSSPGSPDGEFQYHEELYSGFAQEHFARPAVRAFRRHLADRIIRLTGASPASRVLSLGCGIGDLELALAPSVGHITGIDLAPRAIRQASADAARAGVRNAGFAAGDAGRCGFPPGSFDVVIAVFYLHHLPDGELGRHAGLVRSLLAPGGAFYSLDPNRYRLSGAVGKLICPGLMKRYQSPGERELKPTEVVRLFAAGGFVSRAGMYDFVSTPLAGLFPGAAPLYRLGRLADEVLIRAPLLNRLGSNFELIAAKPL